MAYSQIGHRVSDTDRKALQGEQSAVAQQISQAATQLEAVESQALMQMDAGKQTEALAMLDNEATVHGKITLPMQCGSFRRASKIWRSACGKIFGTSGVRCSSGLAVLPL